ncbi:GNAT family N-acetyltransferase [Micromonospora endolithica]|uniref:GNAT family N-acetyltransferase n=1 Tax=Micromonospora endolithica TaxID=230091 RepID=UPI00192E2D37|nr:GNAT family N-acetyltransferase [Micromonospora endolithica]
MTPDRVAPSHPRLVLRPATRGELRATARAHVDFLPTGLFPSLGARFVRRWHRSFLDSPYGVCYVVVDADAPGDGLVGFLLGTTHQSAHTATLLGDRRAIASFAITGVTAMARRPRVAVRLLRSRVGPWARRLLTRRPAGRMPDRSTPAPQVAVITALAVHPAWRGGGIGERLVHRFVAYARNAGATMAELVTPTGPAGAVGFYERLGWEAGSHRHTRDGDGLRTYHHRLRDRPHP